MSKPQLLPSAPDIENAFLGSLMANPKRVCTLAAKHLLQPHHFHQDGISILFRTAMQMWSDRKEIDLVTVIQRLTDLGQLNEACGRVNGEPSSGTSFVVAISSLMPTAEMAEDYIETLKEKHILREVIRRQTTTTDRARTEQNNLSGIIETCQKDALEIAKLARGQEDSPTIKDMVIRSLERIEERQATGTGMVGLSTGLRDLDDKIGGIVRGEYIVLQGERSSGKTALALTMLHYQAVTLGTPCGMTSLDMPALDVVDRLICMEANACLERYRRGQIDSDEFERITKAASKIAQAPIYIDDRTGQSIQEIRASAMLMTQEHGIQLWILDYIQKIRTRSNRDEKRYEQIAAASSEVKDLARDANLAAIVLSQVNTNGEVAGTKEIIDHADTVLGACNREEETDPREEGRFAIKVNKQRQGSRHHDIPVFFDKPCVRFRDRNEEPPDLIDMPKKTRKR